MIDSALVPESVTVEVAPGTRMLTVSDLQLCRRRRTRRIAGGVVAAAGLVNLLSAITPPLRGRLHTLHDLVPMGVNETASALVAAAGIALLLLSRGVRRGQRHAWALAVGVTALSAVLHVVKG